MGSSGGTPAGANLLVNPGLELWQRGTGAFTANNAYSADRWQIALAGTDTLSVSQEAAIKRADSQFAGVCTFVLGSGAGATKLRQALVIADGWHGLLGRTVTFSAWARYNAANGLRAFIETDGTGGTTTQSALHTGGSTFELLTVSVAVPADATYVRVGLQFIASGTAYLDDCIAAIGGGIYQPLTPAEEWERAQRYYEVHAGVNSCFHYATFDAAGTGTYRFPLPFMTRKALNNGPTCTVAGTWAVGNCTQPVTIGPCGSAYSLSVGSLGIGQITFNANSADDVVTSEANP